MKKKVLAVLYWLSIVFVTGVFFGGGFAYRVYSDCSSAFGEARGNLLVAGLRGHEPAASTEIYDSRGDLMATACVENRYPVTLSEVSPWVIDGFIATEDRTFYQHSGISVRGILRAAVHDIRTGERHGASTITQQLARGLFLVPDQTIQRKIQEAFIAMEIERQFEKEEILEMYLNQIYFGAGAYGIEAAARTYFGGISAAELSLAQSAMLVRMVKNPSGFNPRENPDRCLTQRNVALQVMAREGYITREQAEEAMDSPLAVDIHRPEVEQEWDYFSEYVRKYLVRRYGWSAVYEQGLRVQTTLDPEMQEMASWALDTILTSKEPVWDPETGEFIDDAERLRFESSYSRWQAVEDTVSGAPDYIQGALVAVDPSTGYIKAMVGGRDFQDSEFNRAVQARRQPGSSFKPFVYAEAIEQGWSPGSPILDQPVVVELNPGSWRPRNYDHTFHGMVTLRTALARSFNVSAVRLGQAVGVEAVAARAKAMGLMSHVPIVHSLPLGSCMVNPLEMAQAYVPFTTGGLARDAVAVLRVEDRYGNVLEDNTSPAAGSRVLSETGAYLMNSMLQSVVREGTAAGSRWYWGGPYSGRRAGGKTGTTSDYADAWFVGFTPDLVASVWVGYDNHIVRMRLQNGRGQSGSSIALPVWNAFMRKVFAHVPADSTVAFPEPPENSVESAAICTITGKLALETCGEYAREEEFWQGTAPQDYCTLHDYSGQGFMPDTTMPDFTEFDNTYRNHGVN
ncbi:MAG: PBP1A family penicillin-binding protein [Candidatus Aegiribacteria sp.]|nr:PBP1A family penicillin-binding protein [Candidatus Aegiribacteria sp.]MBD3295591.1 PBP1A family penicillin-binding protein [Candidatus Fermentibacteria bacterium]